MIDQQQQRDTADERATLAELVAEGAAELEHERAELERAATGEQPPVPLGERYPEPPTCGTNCC